MRAPTKFSAIDAARIALTSDPIPSTRARDRTLEAAAVMWCRELSIPSLRRLAGEVGRSPVTILTPFGRVIHIYAEVIRREWAELEAAVVDAPPHERSLRVAQHLVALERLDPVLVRLPSLVDAAIAGAMADAGPGRRPRVDVPPVLGRPFRFDQKEAM